MKRLLFFIVPVFLLAVIGIALIFIINPSRRRAEMEEFTVCEEQFKAEKYQEAVGLLEKFIDDHPRSRYSVQAHYYLAKSKQNLGEYSQAMVIWDKIIKKYRKKTGRLDEAYYYLGFGYETIGQTDKAVENYKIVIDKFNNTPAVAGALVGMGRYYEGNGQEAEAVAVYQKVMENYSNTEFITEAEKRFGSINLKNFLEQNIQPYEVKRGDSLEKIAGVFNITPALIRKLNDSDLKALQVGQTLRVIDANNFSILIDLSDCRLSLKNGDQTIKKYPICVGTKVTPTPEGDYKVTDKMVDPTWYSTTATGAKGVIPGGDPKNELGTRWIGFKPAYGIHGTIFPESIGKAESHGCVRMHNADVEELYDLIGAGTPVKIIQ